MGSRIGHIDANGTIAEYAVPTPDAKPHAIAPASDGSYWVSLWGANKIARFMMDGAISEYEIPVTDAEPHGIIVDGHGNIWVALENTGIGHFAGRI